MVKLYDSNKHLNIKKFKQEGFAYFENIDFSKTNDNDLANLLLIEIPEIRFKKCTFISFNLQKRIVNSKILFEDCLFLGILDFSETQFNETISIKSSSFNDSVLFKNTVFKDVLEFYNNVVKPNTKAEVSFKVDKKIAESGLFSGIQIKDSKFGCETSFFGRDFGLIGFLQNVEFGSLFWMTKTSFGEKFDMKNLSFKGEKLTDFLKCLQIFKNSLKRSSFETYANDVGQYEELIKNKTSQTSINIKDIPFPEIPEKENDYNLYTTEETAKILHMRVNTLERWRCERRGPKATKIGRKVFYKKSDLDAYINTLK